MHGDGNQGVPMLCVSSPAQVCVNFSQSGEESSCLVRGREVRLAVALDPRI